MSFSSTQDVGHCAFVDEAAATVSIAVAAIVSNTAENTANVSLNLLVITIQM